MGKKLTNNLTAKRLLFCKLYASDKEFFGNGVWSYMKAFELAATKKNYGIAKTEAAVLLTNPNILAQIDKMMDVYINNQVADKELAFVVIQKADLSSKVAAIREYNRVKGRVTEKHKIIDPYGDYTDEEIEEEITNRRERQRVRESSTSKKKAKSS